MSFYFYKYNFSLYNNIFHNFYKQKYIKYNYNFYNKNNIQMMMFFNNNNYSCSSCGK